MPDRLTTNATNCRRWFPPVQLQFHAKPFGPSFEDGQWLVRGTGRDAVAYLQYVYRERMDYPTLKRKVAELRDRFAADVVLIEETGSGIGLIQELQHESRVHPIGIQPEGDKLTRMSVQSAKIEAGRVFVPESATWIGDFRSEVMAFPNGKHDDQVDTVSQLLAWLDRHQDFALGMHRVKGMR